MKSVCILGSKGAIRDASKLDASSFLAACGNNTGNLLFQYACTQIFENVSRGNIGVDIPYRHDHVNNNHDFLVLPSANFLNPNFNLADLVAYLSKVNIPIIPIGLGAQCKNTVEGFPKLQDLPPSIQNFISEIRSKSPLLFVRGDFTKEILVSYGFEPSVICVSGCPSNFIGDLKTIQDGFDSLDQTHENDVSLLVTGDEVWPQDLRKRELERKLVSLLMERGGGYLVQSVEPLVRNIFEYRGSQISEEFAKILRYIGFNGLSNEPRSYLRLYSSVQSWMFGIRDISLSTGLRLHGNMCSLQAGIPALWIYHDSRTEELCKTMALPAFSMAEANESLTSGDYISMARSLIKELSPNYLMRRQELADSLKSKLAEIGILIWPDASPAVSPIGQSVHP